jgi:hypothetical protein
VLCEGIFSFSERFFNSKLIAISLDFGFAVLIAVNFRTVVFLDVIAIHAVWQMVTSVLKKLSAFIFCPEDGAGIVL